MERKHKIVLTPPTTGSDDAFLFPQGKKPKTKSFASNDDVNPWTGVPFSARYHSILATRSKLPVYLFMDQLLEKVNENQCVVVEGETGSGTFVYLLVCLFVCLFCQRG